MRISRILILSGLVYFQVNAKIADYGISRFTAPYGLTAQEGTPGYRAPEVTRGETYSFKADVFSFGITLYTMLTGGSHPFEELEYKNEMDRAISEVCLSN